jgi:hypothetical protein
VEILKGDRGRRKRVRVLEVPLRNWQKLENMKQEGARCQNPGDP